MKKRRLGVDRCVSLSSASPTSDSDNTDDDEDSMTDSGLSTSVDSDMNEDKSTDDGKSKLNFFSLLSDTRNLSSLLSISYRNNCDNNNL